MWHFSGSNYLPLTLFKPLALIHNIRMKSLVAALLSLSILIVASVSTVSVSTSMSDSMLVDASSMNQHGCCSYQFNQCSHIICAAQLIGIGQPKSLVATASAPLADLFEIPATRVGFYLLSTPPPRV